ncbi:MAG: LysR substrate-binding domain-containing protein [Sphingomonas adhaesiva]|uniref:LysR substrate-binding domain-containing protein n=1 Tax=Sphingomonas adhaesiva TaxID=28212 RepID=UPI002FF4A9E7
MNIDTQDRNASIRIGFFASLFRDRMADALMALARDWPAVVVGVEEMALAELLPAAAAGRVTLAIHPGVAAPGVPSCIVWHDHALVLLPPGHRLAAVAEVTPSMLADEILLTCSERSRAALHRFLAERLFVAAPPPVRMVSPAHAQTLFDRVADGHGVMLTCESQVDRAVGRLVARPIASPDAAFAVSASWSAAGIAPVAAALLALLRD